MIEEILNGVLAKTLNMPTDKINEVLKDDSKTKEEKISTFLNYDVERVKTFKDNATESFQNGYKKAKSEVLTEYEKELKSNFGINEDLKGSDLINKIIEVKTKVENSGDNIKTSQEYQDLILKHNEQITEQKNSYEAKINELNSEHKNFITVGKVKSIISDELSKLPIIENENKLIAGTTRKNFVNEILTSFNFDENNDKLIVKNLKGELLQDEHGNTISLSDIIKEKSSNYFEYKKNNGGSNIAGTTNYAVGGNGSIPKIKNENELAVYLDNNSLTIEERIETKSYYDEHGF